MSVTVDQQDSLVLAPSIPPTISPDAWFLCGGRRPELEWSVMTNGTADPYWNSSSKQSWSASNRICGRRQRIFSISVITHNSGMFPITLPSFYNWFSLSIPVVSCASPLLFTWRHRKHWRFSLYVSLCLHDCSHSPPDFISAYFVLLCLFLTPWPRPSFPLTVC